MLIRRKITGRLNITKRHGNPGEGLRRRLEVRPLDAVTEPKLLVHDGNGGFLKNRDTGKVSSGIADRMKRGGPAEKPQRACDEPNEVGTEKAVVGADGTHVGNGVERHERREQTEIGTRIVEAGTEARLSDAAA